MCPAGEHTLREITTQDESWRSAFEAARGQRDAIQKLWHDNRGLPVVFTGCGSALNLSKFAAVMFQTVTGAACRAAAASELLLHTESITSQGDLPLVVAFSRSGETTETVQAANKMASGGSDVIAVTCEAESRLARLATATIVISEGREESVAQTRSLAGMMVGALSLAALVNNDRALLDDLTRLPSLAAGIMGRSEAIAEAVGVREGYRRITYLGSGAMFGLAREGALKMTEMSLSMADAHTFLEYRHGPMALVDHEHLIVALLSDDMRDHEVEVLHEIRRSDGRLLAVANRDEGLSELGEVLALGGPVGPWARAVLYLPVLQFLGYHRGLAKGVDPDRPRNVHMAVTVDGLEQS